MRRVVAGVVVGVVLLLGAVALGAGYALESGPVRAALGGAVQGATGHASSVGRSSEVSVRGLWTLRPTLEVRDVTFANPPGFSRPNIATVKRVGVQVALLPLLSRRVEVRDVTLVGVDVLLERDASGRGNWESEKAAKQEKEPAATGGQADDLSGWGFSVAHVTVEDVRVAMLGGMTASISKLEGAPLGGAVTGDLVVNGVTLALTGSLAEAGRGQLWLRGGGLEVDVAGAVEGVTTVRVRAADLAALGPLVGRGLPGLRDVDLTGEVGPGGKVSMRGTAGGADLGSWWPGLRVGHLEVSAPGMEQAVQLKGEGMVGRLPVSVAFNVVKLSALSGSGPVPFQALVLGDGATVSAQGSATVSGGAPEMTLSARVPDLRRTGALAGVALPALRDLALDVRLAAAPGGAGVLARGLRVASAQGDLAGDLAFRGGARRSVRGSLVSQRLDLDELLAAPAPAPAPAPGGGAPAPVVAAGESMARPLPFAALRQADADVHLSVRQVVLQGAEYRAFEARVLLQEGVLRVDPAQVLTPGGAVQGQLLADASASPPTVSVTVLAPGVGAGPLGAAFGVPDAATGMVDMDVQLKAAGADLRAMGATLEGHLGVAFVDGDVDNQVLAGLFGGALRAANVPLDVGGRSRVRCFAVRADAVGGRVTVRSLALDAARARVEGEGVLSLVDGTMDMHLRPTIRIGGTGVAVPVRLSGPLRAPVPGLERGALAPGRVGISIGAALPDPCGPALAAARDGRPGPQPR